MTEKTLDISIPHSLTKEEARRRIVQGLQSAHDQYASKLGHIDQKWSGDRMDFAVFALGGRVSGWIEVGDKTVEVHVLLPWLLAKLAERLRPQIQGEVRRVLELPK